MVEAVAAAAIVFAGALLAVAAAAAVRIRPSAASGAGGRVLPWWTASEQSQAVVTEIDWQVRETGCWVAAVGWSIDRGGGGGEAGARVPLEHAPAFQHDVEAHAAAFATAGSSPRLNRSPSSR